MSAADEVLNRLIAWGTRDENVRRLVLVGSRARSEPPDELADIDLQVYALASEPYLRDEAWLSEIGPIWVCVRDEYPDVELLVPTRLVLFAGGAKVDFAFYPAGAVSLGIRAGFPHRVLLDKDDAAASRAEPSALDRCPPSAEELARTVEEFWFEAYHVAKYLARGDLRLARERDWAIKRLLLQVSGWHERPAAVGDDELQRAFAGFDREASWSALLVTMDLFRRLATEVAAARGLTVPGAADHDVSGFILALRDAGPAAAAEPSLEGLRERIGRLDLDLVTQVAERVELARQAGEIKRRQKLSTADYAQERAVMERARAAARDRGLDPRVVEDLFARLIRASVTAQDEDSLRLAGLGTGKSAVIVGGAGRMGRWLARFLSAQGFATGVLDPAVAPEEDAWARRALPTADLVVCSTPPAAIVELYREWARRPPAGVIVDIASIKTPLIEPIGALQRAGGRVASIHPMFGPSTVLLRDADVVVCDTGDPEATAVVERLFQPTTARLVHLPLAEHDRLMADLLSLAHATAIAFALALPAAEHPVRSTTFHALESLAAAVARESPDVYYEIQAMNPYSAAALERLRLALDRLVAAVTARDAQGFRALFAEAEERTQTGK